MIDSAREQEAKMIGERIRWQRKRMGYTQKEFAQILGISIPVLISYEKGRAMPSVSLAAAMSKTLHCPLDALLFKELSEQFQNEKKIFDPKTGECFLFKK